MIDELAVSMMPSRKFAGELLKLGIEEAEAKTQIALCLGEEMDKILRTRKPFDEKAYRASLDALER